MRSPGYAMLWSCERREADPKLPSHLIGGGNGAPFAASGTGRRQPFRIRQGLLAPPPDYRTGRYCLLPEICPPEAAAPFFLTPDRP